MFDRHQLPSTYYRVSLKALIFDEQDRLLVFQDSKGEWEMPGGGWEHDEEPEACLRREIKEEAGLDLVEISAPVCMYVDHRPPAYYKLSIAFRVRVMAGVPVPADDDIVAYRYVTREEFLGLPFQLSEKTVTNHAEQIWSIVET